MHRFTTQIALGAFVALAAAGTPCLADETPTGQPITPSSTLSDIKVARDKETGKLRAPTAEESAALDAKAKTLAPTVVQINRPVTTVQMRADGSAVGKRSLDDMDDVVLFKTQDGKTVMQHSDKAIVEAPAATAELPTE